MEYIFYTISIRDIPICTKWLGTILDTESCHDANFVVSGGTGGCRYDKLCGTTCDDKIGIVETVGFQCANQTLILQLNWKPSIELKLL